MNPAPEQNLLPHSSRTFLKALAAVIVFLAAGSSHAQPLTNTLFAAFDLETTGLSTRTARIIEIAVVKFRNGNILASKSWLVNPGKPITKGAQRVNGMTDEMVADSPPFKEIFPQFADFARDSVLISHNSDFDIGILKTEIQRNNLNNNTYSWTVLDTLKLSRLWFPETKSHSLSNLVTHLNLPQGKFHRALGDATFTKDIFLRGISTLPPGTTLNDFAAQSTCLTNTEKQIYEPDKRKD